jgi:hypothetical protein
MSARLADGFPLLLMPRVQKELKLSAEQIERVGKQWQAVRKLSEPNPEADQPPTPEQQQKTEARQQEMEDKAATNVLDAAQQQRLRQILLQARGPGLLLRNEVAAELELTSAQRAAIRETLKQTATQRTALLAKPAADDVTRRKQRAELRALRQTAATKAQATLTPEQQKKWKEMLGEPFDLEP